MPDYETHVKEHVIPVIAEFAHNANRAYCESIGDTSQVTWHNAPQWQKNSAIAGVRFHLGNVNADASASHQSWYDQKLADGWSYGPEKDEGRKQHPCMVPFGELPFEQQIKDHIFRSVVHGYISTFVDD